MIDRKDFEVSFVSRSDSSSSFITNLAQTCFEDLPNELFCEVFDYLDGCDIYKAFVHLNHRLDNLVINSFLPLRINLCPKSRITLEEQCRTVLLPNRHRLLSIHLKTPLVIQEFFDHCMIDESFTRLQSIHLHGTTVNTVLTVLFHLNFLPRLSSLSIQLEDDYYYNLRDIYRLIFRFPSLKYSKISIPDYEESDITIPMSINGKPSSIEHLVMEFPCTIREITSLLHHTPLLQRLTCKHFVQSDEIRPKKEQPLILTQLRRISIDDCDVPFDDFETFIKPISCQLQMLRLKTSFSPAYLNAQRWKQLIKKHMPHLNEFYFDCVLAAQFTGETNTTPNAETINEFTSSFWIERRWFLELRTEHDELIYSIQSNR